VTAPTPATNSERTRKRRDRFAGGAALLFVGCGASTPLVPRGPHPPHVQEFVTVPYPPPPAQVEEIPSGHRDPRCAWVDGHHRWEGRGFTWQPGRWVVPPPGCYYAAAVVAWSKGGESRLYFTPPRWYRDDAARMTEGTAGCGEPKTCAL
jgi:hypothetical protein